MSTTAITCELLAVNVRSSDLAAVGGGSGNGIVATTPTDGWVVSPPSGQQFDARLMFILYADASTDTFTFVAGDRYPAQRADLGNMTVAMGALDERHIVVETSRFLQDNGTILVTATDAGSALTALMMPKAA